MGLDIEFVPLNEGTFFSQKNTNSCSKYHTYIPATSVKSRSSWIIIRSWYTTTFRRICHETRVAQLPSFRFFDFLSTHLSPTFFWLPRRNEGGGGKRQGGGGRGRKGADFYYLVSDVMNTTCTQPLGHIYIPLPSFVLHSSYAFYGMYIRGHD